MNFRWTALVSVVLLGSTLVAADAFARSQISYGRITNVRQVNIQNQGAQTAGTLVGGALGVASGSGQSRSNRALRGVGGAAVGSRVAGAAGSSTGFEYTVLIGGTNTIRITTEQAGLRVGDCVSVERGAFNNLRLVDDARRVASMLRGKYGATRVVLFGSLAHRAWFHPLTDVDLAVEGIPPSDFYGAWEDADLAIRGRSVDLVALETAPEGIRHALAEDGVEL